MVPANDVIPVPDVAQIRRTLQASLANLMEAQEYLNVQIDRLNVIEVQVRMLALQESSRSINNHADPNELRYLCELQEETNLHVRQMHKSYSDLASQITLLMEQHEWLYDATFAQGGG